MRTSGRKYCVAVVAVAGLLFSATAGAKGDLKGFKKRGVKNVTDPAPQVSLKCKKKGKKGPAYYEVEVKQTLKFNKKVCRWYDQDVDTQFVVLPIPGYEVSKASLSVKSGDVDLYSTGAYTPELDVVQFGSLTIGILEGKNGVWQTQKFKVTDQVKNSSTPEIPFKINIDAAHDTYHWCLLLEKAELVTKYRKKIVPAPLPLVPGLQPPAPFDICSPANPGMFPTPIGLIPVVVD